MPSAKHVLMEWYTLSQSMAACFINSLSAQSASMNSGARWPNEIYDPLMLVLFFEKAVGDAMQSLNRHLISGNEHEPCSHFQQHRQLMAFTPARKPLSDFLVQYCVTAKLNRNYVSSSLLLITKRLPLAQAKCNSFFGKLIACVTNATKHQRCLPPACEF